MENQDDPKYYNMVQYMTALLKKNCPGVEYDPSVPYMMTELYFRRATNLIKYAHGFSRYYNGNEIGPNDTKMAIRNQHINDKKKARLQYSVPLEKAMSEINKLTEPNLTTTFPENVQPHPDCSLLETDFQIGEPPAGTQ